MANHSHQQLGSPARCGGSGGVPAGPVLGRGAAPDLLHRQAVRRDSEAVTVTGPA